MNKERFCVIVCCVLYLHTGFARNSILLYGGNGDTVFSGTQVESFDLIDESGEGSISGFIDWGRNASEGAMVYYPPLLMTFGGRRDFENMPPYGCNLFTGFCGEFGFGSGENFGPRGAVSALTRTAPAGYPEWWVIGGVYGNAVVRNVWQIRMPATLKVAGGTISSISPLLNVPRAYHFGGFLNGHQYFIFGGISSLTNRIPLDSGEMFSYQNPGQGSNKWVNTSVGMKTPRAYGASAVLGNELYAIGGNSLGTVDKFNPVAQTWTTLAPLNTARAYAAAAVAGGFIYVFGGETAVGGLALDTIERYHPGLNRWDTLAVRLNSPRSRLSAVAVGPTLLDTSLLHPVLLDDEPPRSPATTSTSTSNPLVSDTQTRVIQRLVRPHYSYLPTTFVTFYDHPCRGQLSIGPQGINISYPVFRPPLSENTSTTNFPSEVITLAHGSTWQTAQTRGSPGLLRWNVTWQSSSASSNVSSMGLEFIETGDICSYQDGFCVYRCAVLSYFMASCICPRNMRPPSNTLCLPCSAGSTSDIVYTGGTCTPCPRGSFGDTPGAGCTTCPAGTFTNTLGATVCQVCSSGRFAPNNGSSTCLSCGLGRYQPEITNASKCIGCPSGRANPFMGAGAVDQCIKCQAGSFAPVDGQSMCEVCPMGTFAEGIGSSVCSSCASGRYSITSGLASRYGCLLCPAGRSSDSSMVTNASSSATGSGDPVADMFCPACAAGSFAAMPGSSTCSPCAAGRYQSDPGMTSCEMCPRGRFGSDTTGNQTGTALVQCSPCPSGMYGVDQGAVSGQSCIPCSAGTANPFPGASECSPCDAGYFSSSSGQTACVQCPRGFFRSGAAAAAAAGAAGGSNNATQCLPCPAGSYGATLGRDSCELCPPNTYAMDRGLTACQACPSSSICLLGSSLSLPAEIPLKLQDILSTNPVTSSSLRVSSTAASKPASLPPSLLQTFVRSSQQQQDEEQVLKTHHRFTSLASSSGTMTSTVTSYFPKPQDPDPKEVVRVWSSALYVAAGVSGALICCFALTTVLAGERHQRGWSKLDVLYTRKHWTAVPGPMIRTRTPGGGLATLVAICVVGCVVGALAAEFFRTNWRVESSLELGFSSTMSSNTVALAVNASVAFYGLSGSCMLDTAASGPGPCSSAVRVHAKGLNLAGMDSPSASAASASDGGVQMVCTWLVSTRTCLVQWRSGAKRFAPDPTAQLVFEIAPVAASSSATWAAGVSWGVSVPSYLGESGRQSGDDFAPFASAPMGVAEGNSVLGSSIYPSASDEESKGGIVSGGMESPDGVELLWVPVVMDETAVGGRSRTGFEVHHVLSTRTPVASFSAAKGATFRLLLNRPPYHLRYATARATGLSTTITSIMALGSSVIAALGLLIVLVERMCSKKAAFRAPEQPSGFAESASAGIGKAFEQDSATWGEAMMMENPSKSGPTSTSSPTLSTVGGAVESSSKAAAISTSTMSVEMVPPPRFDQ